MGVFDYSHKEGGGGQPSSRPWESLWFKLLLGGAALLLVCERILTRRQRTQQARKRPAPPGAGGGDLRKWLEDNDRIRPRRRRT